MMKNHRGFIKKMLNLFFCFLMLGMTSAFALSVTINEISPSVNGTVTGQITIKGSVDTAVPWRLELKKTTGELVKLITGNSTVMNNAILINQWDTRPENNGAYQIVLTASSNTQIVSQSRTITIQNQNEKPKFMYTLPTTNVEAGKPLSLLLYADDLNNPNLVPMIDWNDLASTGWYIQDTESGTPTKSFEQKLLTLPSAYFADFSQNSDVSLLGNNRTFNLIPGVGYIVQSVGKTKSVMMRNWGAGLRALIGVRRDNGSQSGLYGWNGNNWHGTVDWTDTNDLMMFQIIISANREADANLAYVDEYGLQAFDSSRTTPITGEGWLGPLVVRRADRPLSYSITSVKRNGSTISMPATATLNRETGFFQWKTNPSETAGDYVFACRVQDEQGAFDTHTITLNVAPLVALAKISSPVFNPNQYLAKQITINGLVKATGLSSWTLTDKTTQTQIANGTNPVGDFTSPTADPVAGFIYKWDTTAVQPDGMHEIELQVNGTNGSMTESVKINLNNQAPDVVLESLSGTYSGELLIHGSVTTNLGITNWTLTDETTTTKKVLASGTTHVALNSVLVTWNTLAENNGLRTVRLTATNRAGVTASATAQITITNANSAPEFMYTMDTATVEAGKPLSLLLYADDVNNPNLFSMDFSSSEYIFERGGVGTATKDITERVLALPSTYFNSTTTTDWVHYTQMSHYRLSSVAPSTNYIFTSIGKGRNISGVFESSTTYWDANKNLINGARHQWIFYPKGSFDWNAISYPITTNYNAAYVNLLTTGFGWSRTGGGEGWIGGIILRRADRLNLRITIKPSTKDMDALKFGSVGAVRK